MGKMKKASDTTPRFQVKRSANRKPRKGKIHHDLHSSEDDVSDYENELHKKMQPGRVSGRDTRNKQSSSYGIKDKGTIHHELSSTEDEVSDNEKESNQPRRVSGRDTRNKVGSAKKIERSSTSEVGKSAKEHLGKLVGGKAKKHQPLSSSKDSVSDYDESEQVLKIQPEKVYNIRSNAERKKFLKKSEDGTSDCASELKMQLQFKVASKKVRGFAGRGTRKPDNPRSRTKVSEISEDEEVEVDDVPLWRQTIVDHIILIGSCLTFTSCLRLRVFSRPAYMIKLNLSQLTLQTSCSRRWCR